MAAKQLHAAVRQRSGAAACMLEFSEGISDCPKEEPFRTERLAPRPPPGGRTLTLSWAPEPTELGPAL